MTNKLTNPRKNQRGFAHILLIVLALVAVAAAGGLVYWRMSSYNNNKGDNAKGKQAADGSNSATLSDECLANTGDANICHLGAIADLSKYASEVHMTMEGADGSITSVIKYDGKGNHQVDTGTGIQGISLNGKYYIYMDKWYDTGSDSSQAPKDSLPAFNFATTAGIKYENQGKEKCGNATCFKYKMTGGILGDGVVVATFGDKDYLIRSINSTGGLMGKLNMTVEYKDITITAPANAAPISSFGQ